MLVESCRERQASLTLWFRNEAPSSSDVASIVWMAFGATAFSLFGILISSVNCATDALVPFFGVPFRSLPMTRCQQAAVLLACSIGASGTERRRESKVFALRLQCPSALLKKSMSCAADVTIRSIAARTHLQGDWRCRSSNGKTVTFLPVTGCVQLVAHLTLQVLEVFLRSVRMKPKRRDE